MILFLKTARESLERSEVSDHDLVFGNYTKGLALISYFYSVAIVCVRSWATGPKELGKLARHRARHPRRQGEGEPRGRVATGEVHFLPVLLSFF